MGKNGLFSVSILGATLAACLLAAPAPARESPGKVPTTTVLSATPNPALVGQQVTVTAVVTDPFNGHDDRQRTNATATQEATEVISCKANSSANLCHVRRFVRYKPNPVPATKIYKSPSVHRTDGLLSFPLE